MTQHAEEGLLSPQKKAAVEGFAGALMPCAKMTGLYQAGHPAIAPIAERVKNLLLRALGQDTTIVFDVKGKSVLVEDTPLAETKDITLLGSTLHMLGIGQVLFTSRLTGDGMFEFMKVLMLKPDDSKNLTAIQKDLLNLKIPGLQMAFVISVVDTGEMVADQQPGRLTEEQVLAFTKAETPQDFLLLLRRQNEPLAGKAAESVTAALDDALNRGASAEQFAAAMPWDFYDPRIKARWDAFAAKLDWAPKAGKKPCRRWDRNTVVSQTGLFRDADLAAIKDRTALSKPDALKFSLETVHSVLQRPASETISKLALMAYGRVLAELGHDGDIGALFAEFNKWREPGPLSEAVMKLMADKVVSPLLARNMVAYVNGIAENTPEFASAENFMAALGARGIPFYLEELKDLSDVQNRRKLCLLLTAVSRRLKSVQAFIPALGDADWFLVRNVVMILGDVNMPGTAELIAPSLKHDHQRVREETIRSLGKIGNPSAVAALSSFVLTWDKSEEVFQAITALSFLPHAGIDERLIQAYNAKDDPETRLAIVTALSRVATPASLKFLEELSRRSIMEMLTGRNKALRSTAKESLGTVKEALKAKK